MVFVAFDALLQAIKVPLNFKYGAWGEVVGGNTSADATPFGFTGRSGSLSDSNTTFVLNWNRWFDVSLGRWLSTDPVGIEGGKNYFMYCLNNSIEYLDPAGLASLSYDAATGQLTFDPRPEEPNGKPSTISCRLRVTGKAKANATDSFSTNDSWPLAIESSNTYGPAGAYIETNDPAGRDIHGGGSDLPNPLAPRQGFEKTHGCVRCQNEDIQKLSTVMDKFRSTHPKTKIPYKRTKGPTPDTLPKSPNPNNKNDGNQTRGRGTGRKAK